jgi:hypothetical protein
MRIRFLSDQVYETGGPKKGPKFEKGSVLDESEVGEALGLKQPSAEWVDGFMNRWLQRGVAVDHDAVPDDPPPAVDPAVDQIEKTDLTKLTRGELDELAAKRGIDISAAKNKADVIVAIEQADVLGEAQ